MTLFNKYNLQNNENYNKNLEINLINILTKYINLINDFLKQSLDNIQITNIKYKNYIMNSNQHTHVYIP